MTNRSIGLVLIALLVCGFVSAVDARWLVINSIPADAVVKVNDRIVGTTPIRLEDEAEETVTVTLSMETLSDYVFSFDFSENKVVFIDLAEKTELDEDIFWQRKTSDNIKNIKTVVPTETPFPTEPEIMESPIISAEMKNVPELNSLPDKLDKSDDKGLAIFALVIASTGEVDKAEPFTEFPSSAFRKYLEKWLKM
ncbi:PEGA domain-containing protein [bacterium]|nr:PEGA domain-containing protein [bacterium]